MIKLILLLLIWNIVTFIFYWLGKLSIRNLSEQKLIEVTSLPFFNVLSTNTPRSFNWLTRFGLFIGFLFVLGQSFRVRTYLFQLQNYFFNQPNSVFLNNNFFLLFLVSLGFIIATILIIIILIIRITPNISIKKWYYFPTLAETKAKIKHIKNLALLINSGLLLAFILGMHDYIIFNQNDYTLNSFWSLSEKTNTYESIKRANLTYDYKRQYANKSVKKREDLEPKFWITTEDNSFNIWANDINTDTEKLKKIAKNLIDNQVNFNLNMPDIIEKYTWREKHLKSDYNNIIGVYDYVNQLQKGILTPKKVGETINYNELDLRLDSAIFTNKYQLIPSDKKQLITYFTINNSSESDIYFGTLSNLKAISQKNQKIYSISVFTNDSSKALIVTDTTISLIRGFDILESELPIIIRYQPNPFSNEYFNFEVK